MICLAQRLGGSAVAACIFVLAACTNSTQGTDVPVEDDPKTPCSSYVETMARCQAKLLRSAPGVAAERVGSTRSSITAHVAAAKTDAERAKLARECESGLKQLRSICP